MGIQFLLFYLHTSTMTITEENGVWNIVTKTSMKSMELTFSLGQEFDETTSDGRKCKTTVTMEGNKLITKQKPTKAGEKDVTAVREFTDDGLTYTTTVEDVTATQVYKRS